MTENHNQSQNTSLERTNIYVPDIGNPDAVTVSSILVSVGDVINIDDNIVSLETDKASMDIPATSSGEVVEVFIKEGAKVKTGDLILSIITNTTNTVTSNAINTQVSPASDKHLNTNNLNSNNFDSSINNIPLSADQVHNKNTSHNTDLSYSTNKNHDSILRDLQQKVFASPSIRLYARQNGIELNKVQGTGKNNRITLLDIQNYQNKTNNNTDSYAPNNTLKLNQNQLINQADNTNSHNKYGEIYTQELGRIKKISAKHLTNCWQTIPHVTQFDEADITELEEFRIQLNKEYQAKKQNTKLTLLAFLIKAVVYVLKEYPDFNASLDETAQNLIYKKYYNIGFAVDTAQGLLVPVIKNADQKSVNEIANEIVEIVSRAKTVGLKPTDMEGATFTISSLGSIGGTMFTPIINAPELAILGVSKSSIKPVWNNKEFEPKLILPLSLSYDHRAIDGVMAAKFTTSLAKLLADLRRVIL